MKTAFKPIGQTHTLSNQIVNQVEESIRAKVLVPGQKLPGENDLTSIFRVSRPVLREALQMLSTKGLITIRKGSGAFVNEYHEALAFNPMHLYLELNLGKDLILQLVSIRNIFEPDLAQMAAENRSDADIVELELIMQKIRDINDQDHFRLGELDRDFHLKIAHSTNNSIIPLIVDPVFQMMPKIKEIILDHVKQKPGAAVYHHQKIL
ncbi:FadR/GntR family transcriptional regulator, partial [Candidatus Neomarinimicrobiota bacterium]